MSDDGEIVDCCDDVTYGDTITPYALPLSQSIRANNTSEVNSDVVPISSYQFPPQSTHGKPKVQYSPDIHAKMKYPINNYVSSHHLSKSYESYLSSVFIPTKLQDALSNPKWVDANVEMESLEKKNQNKKNTPG